MKPIRETHKGRPWAIIIESRDMPDAIPPSDPFNFSEMPYEMLCALNKTHPDYVPGDDIVVVFSMGDENTYTLHFDDNIEAAEKFYSDFNKNFQSAVDMDKGFTVEELAKVYGSATNSYDLMMLLDIETIPARELLMILSGGALTYNQLKADWGDRDSVIAQLATYVGHTMSVKTFFENVIKFANDYINGAVTCVHSSENLGEAITIQLAKDPYKTAEVRRCYSKDVNYVIKLRD